MASAAPRNWFLFGAPSLAVAAMLLGIDARAETETPEVIEITGKQGSYSIDDISSATKTDTPLLDVPQSVSIVTRQLIDDLGMRSMADVVRFVPGVQMAQGEGHRDAPVMRGNASTADFFVDGIRDDVQYYRDLYNVERVEVLKGPNAMIFGRGGGGGVINRVTEQADGRTERELTLTAGEYGQRRGSIDVGQGVNEQLALRLNGMYENSEEYRRFKDIERYGINPTATYAFSDSTRLSLGYEYLNDERTVDRGVPSINGAPVPGVVRAFYGNPHYSHAEAEVNLASANFEHAFSPTLRMNNQTLYGDYDKFYSNVLPGAVSGANVSLSGYNNDTQRDNLFNQTNLTWETQTWSIGHTLLTGVEFSRQTTDNFRNTGYFDPVANITTISVPLAAPVSRAPVYFRQSATDADNHSTTDVAAVYVQDQIAITEQIIAIAGVRFDRFQIDFDNNRNGDKFNREDNETETRYGIIYKPINHVSLYVSRSNSYLPSSGDQFSSLDATSQSLEPEEFENTEVGAKWDVLPNLSLSGAVYRLDRENTSAPGPIAGTIVLTGSQRSEGFELGFAGAITPVWAIVAGYAYQDAEITSTTSAAPRGRDVPLVPEHSFSVWNRYQFAPRWGAGLGVVYSDSVYASISNAVTLESYTRVDAALFFEPNDRLSAQLNVANVFNEHFHDTAHSDNNITPGTPRTIRATLTTRF